MVGAETAMSRLDDLPHDQRATLSLLLCQRKSYAEVAGLLSIDQRALHDRAHAALAVLAPREARELSAADREEIGDYLLSQQASVAARLRTRTHLESAEPARAWARAVAGELAPLAVAPLPDIPGPLATSSAPRDTSEERPPASPSHGQRVGGPARVSMPSSRVGGALLLAAILAGVIVAVILITGSGGSSPGRSASRAARGTTSTNASSTSTATTSPARWATPTARMDIGRRASAIITSSAASRRAASTAQDRTRSPLPDRRAPTSAIRIA